MGDLISRKAVEKAIKEYFKMIIDNTDDDVDCVLDYNKNLCDTINEISVACDVDKVIEQLKRLQDDGIPTRSAINFVKRGGEDE